LPRPCQHIDKMQQATGIRQSDTDDASSVCLAQG
jgi:hypothetical protein